MLEQLAQQVGVPNGELQSALSLMKAVGPTAGLILMITVIYYRDLRPKIDKMIEISAGQMIVGRNAAHEIRKSAKLRRQTVEYMRAVAKKFDLEEPVDGYDDNGHDDEDERPV